ncbi:MAG TPA: hypothetical protein VFS20_27015 [Longimicrobium sp.]|nr:hypothetical protein [Longimicrobium sp.]
MKKKLKLKIEELHIDQFQVQPAVAAPQGTVRGFDSMNSNSDPCFCPVMPITFSCYVGPECW